MSLCARDVLHQHLHFSLFRAVASKMCVSAGCQGVLGGRRFLIGGLLDVIEECSPPPPSKNSYFVRQTFSPVSFWFVTPFLGPNGRRGVERVKLLVHQL